ncbi:hypothetical protein [Lysinibacillus sp. JNUCC 51]|uniref:hypothetical protein n=1 Tax=Lysinibacillus sp. JNUCC-51 TaxID=2792479 RepID=UPI0019368933|nr:hypothetical protein JNUCC51_21775 [Lysinibacillus sp. JNUCC-51]
MSKNFEISTSRNVSGVRKLISQYTMLVGNKKVGIKIYLGSDGYYQMDTSHYYRCKDCAGIYISSAANFSSEEEALNNAHQQLTIFYDGEGEWRVNEDF